MANESLRKIFGERVALLDKLSMREFDPDKVGKDGKKLAVAKFEGEVTLDFSEVTLDQTLDLAADSVIIKIQGDWRKAGADEKRAIQTKLANVNVAEYINRERRRRSRVEAAEETFSRLTVGQFHELMTKADPSLALVIEDNVTAGKYTWDDLMPMAKREAA